MARILLARRDRGMRNFLSQQLQKYGHRVTITDCHLGMMAAINDNNDFHVVIAEFGMDGRDGFELVKELEQIAPETRVVFMSGFSAIGITPSSARDAFTARIVTRPFHLRELPEQVTAILSEEAAA